MKRLLLYTAFIFLSLFVTSTTNAQDMTFEDCAKAQNITGLTNSCSKHVVSVYECLTEGREGKKIPFSQWQLPKDDVINRICSNLPRTPWGGECNQCDGGTSSSYTVDIEGRPMTYNGVFSFAHQKMNSESQPITPGAPTRTPTPTPTPEQLFENDTKSVSSCFNTIRIQWESSANRNCTNITQQLATCMNLETPENIYVGDPFWINARNTNSTIFTFTDTINEYFSVRSIGCTVTSDDLFVKKVMEAYSLVQGNIATQSQEVDTDLAKYLAANCGFEGGSCCDPALTAILDKRPNVIQNFGLFERLFGFVNKIGKSGAEGAIAEVGNLAGQQVLCQGNLRPGLEVEGEENPIIALNQYDSENKTYAVERNCTANIQIDEYQACIDQGPKVINRSEVKACNCVNVEGGDQVSNTSLEGLNHTQEKIFGDICGASLVCLECLKDGNIYQAFSTVKKCKPMADEAAAEAELEQRISTQTSAASERVNAKNNPQTGTAVLGWVANLCSLPTNPLQESYCRLCVLSGGNYNVAGCTRTPLQTYNTVALCQNLSGGEKAECRACASRGEYWSAIGCINYDIPSIIKNQIFGFGMGVAGTVALGCIMYAAILMQTSSGDPEKVTKAQELMTSCIIGLIVIIFSIFIIRVIGVDILKIPGFS